MCRTHHADCGPRGVPDAGCAEGAQVLVAQRRAHWLEAVIRVGEEALKEQ